MLEKTIENKATNQTFKLLKAIAIIMVIDDHVSTRIGIFSSIFPYNSFYMPLFMFASGYFYKKRAIKHTLKKGFSNILLPFEIWSLVGFIISLILDKAFGMHWDKTITLERVFNSFFLFPLTSATGASWYAIMFFWVYIIYGIFRAHTNTTKINIEYMIQVCLSIIGCIAIYLCIGHWHWENYSVFNWRLWLCRTAFYLQFYHLGFLFHLHIEKQLKKINPMVICFICILINVFLILGYGDKINFYSTSNMDSFTSIWMPIITSITGILFWYELMTLFAKRGIYGKAIDFIADNTFTIMACHLLFVNIPNLFCFFFAKYHENIYQDFSIDSFISSAWYRYSSNTRLLGFFF